MTQSLLTANLETHVRIVAMSLVAGTAIVLGAIHAHVTAPQPDGQAAPVHVVKAEPQEIYSSSDRIRVR